MAQFLQDINSNGNEGYWAGSWFVNGSWWQTGQNGFGNDLYSAGRFNNVTVPQGSTINSAYIKLYGYANESGNAYTRFYGIDEDNTADLTSDPVGRARTTAYTDWDFNAITLNQQYSIDITAIIQEIVNRGGWGSNNSLAIIHVNDGTPISNFRHFKNWHGDSSYPVKIEINYTAPVFQKDTSLLYRVRRPIATPITKMLRYCITDPEDTAVPFLGIKIAKSGHNVLNTSNPNNLKFSSDYNTLKYFMEGASQIHVVSPGEFYNFTGYIVHNLGYFPFAEVYAKDDLMSAYCPLGRLQVGSGAYRQFFFYVTTTRLYIVANGWSTTDDQDYYVDFYYKIFKNNLNL